MRVAVVMALIALTNAAGAQEAKCGPDSSLASTLDWVVNFFADSDSASAAFRKELGVVSPPRDAKRSIVSNARECQRLLAATRAEMRRGLAKGQDSLVTWMTFEFVRVGDYFVAVERAAPDPKVIVNGRSQVLVFRTRDLKLVARFLG